MLKLLIMKAIEIKNIYFKYEETSPFVINDLSLTVNKGEFLCVLGKNGSGKSTLAKIINGLLTQNSGTVEVFGLSTSDKANLFEIRKKVGMVFQNPDNQMVATIVEDDIAFGPENIGVPSSEIEERITFALKATDMQEFRHVAGQRLSGGQKQRIAIAGVLAVKPDVLILDESTAMLDPKGREEVIYVVKKLNKDGITVIDITHYMDEAVSADRVIIVNDGKIVKDGTPLEIFSSCDELNDYGLEVPRAVYIANELKKAGIPIKNGVLTEAELSNELCKLFQKI